MPRWTAMVITIGIFTGAFAGRVHADDGSPLSRAPIHRYSFDGEGGDGAVLVDGIGDSDGRVLIVPPPKPLPYHEGSTTLVVFPDTEVYTAKQSDELIDMMEWVADNVDRRRIESVLHVGDVTNNNRRHEWEHARKAFDLIEGKVPYVLAAGNHDYDHTPGRQTLMNDFFMVGDRARGSTLGGVYEEGKLENHYQFLTINGQKWLVLSLEMGPRNQVIDWANRVVDEHEDHLVIILTHGYLYYGNQRYDHREGAQRATPYQFYGEGADGEMLWNRLVRKHENVMMVICGHLSSQYVGYREDEGDHGNVVHQMLVDYEKLKGGRGFLRLLEFLPDGRTVQVRTYSPVTKEIRSPITKGDSPLRQPELEEFQFVLQAASGDQHLLAVNAVPGDPKPDDIDSRLVSKDEPEVARLDGKGQLVIESNDARGFGDLGADLVKGRKRVSFEVWFTPTAGSYQWDPILQFKGGDDAFYYTFRTLNRHRAELIIDGHNEDVQRDVGVTVGKPMHVVVTYDQEGHDGRPLLSSYVDGSLTGRMVTTIRLSELKLTRGSIGPFSGKFDEVRIYDYPLSEAEVKGNFERGPSVIAVKD